MSLRNAFFVIVLAIVVFINPFDASTDASAVESSCSLEFEHYETSNETADLQIIFDCVHDAQLTLSDVSNPSSGTATVMAVVHHTKTGIFCNKSITWSLDFEIWRGVHEYNHGYNFDYGVLEPGVSNRTYISAPRYSLVICRVTAYVNGETGPVTGNWIGIEV